MPLLLATPIRTREYGRVLYIYQEYIKMFKKIDVDLLILPPMSKENYHKITTLCDGLLLTGGGDIDAKYFNQECHPTIKAEQPEVEAFEFDLIEAFSRQKKPILGICRGIQTINVHFGGTLIQDIDSQYKTTQNHQQIKRIGYQHYVNIPSNTMFATKLKSRILVNSYHHQNIDRIAPGFIANAISDDGLIEGIENDTISAVQWHPEKINDENQQAILSIWKKLLTKGE